MNNSLEQFRAIYYSLPLKEKRLLVEALKAQLRPDQEKSSHIAKHPPG